MSPRNHQPAQMTEIGWREYIGLPELGIPKIKAKIDTGARTTALHAIINQVYEKDGQHFVDFQTPIPETKLLRQCTCPVVETRAVKNTSGIPDNRIVIETLFIIGRRQWHIELTLADREQMTFDIILGRTAIREHRYCVNPGRSFLAGDPVYSAPKSKGLK